MAVVREDTVKIGFDVDDSGLKKTKTDLDGLKDSVKGAGDELDGLKNKTKKPASGLDKLKTNADKAKSSLKQMASTNLKGLESGISTIASKAAALAKSVVTTATKIAAAAGTAAGGLGVMGVKYNADMEQYNASFETMLGSAQKAQKMTSALKQMAAETPFEMTDVADATKTLLAFGISEKDVLPDMKMLGDVSQGNAEKFNSLALAFGQTAAAGKLTGDNLLQFINVGFNPLQEMSKSTGKSMAELRDEMSKGKISMDDVTKSFQRATSKGGLFYQSMEKQSKTLSGQLSTLQDNAKSMLGDITKGLADKLSKKVLPQVNDALGRLNDSFNKGGFKGFAKQLVTEIKSAAQQIGPAIKEMLPKAAEALGSLFKSIKDWITKNGGTIADQMADMAVKIVAAFYKGFTGKEMDAKKLDQLKNTVQGLVDFLKSAAGFVANHAKAIGIAIAGMWTAMQVGKGVKAVAGVVQNVKDLTKAFQDFNKAKDAYNAAKTAASAAGGAAGQAAGSSGSGGAGNLLSGLFSFIGGKGAQKAATKAGAKVGTKVIGKTALKAVPVIGGLISAGLSAAGGVSDLVNASKEQNPDQKRTKQFQGGTKLAGVGAGAGIGAAVGSVVPGIGTAIGAAVGAGLGGLGVDIGGNKLGEWLANATKETGVLGKAWASVKSTVSDAGSAIGDKLNQAKNTVENAWGTVGSWFSSNVSTPVQNAFSTAGSWIGDKFGQAKNAVTSAWSEVTSFFSDKIITPVKGFFENLGYFFVGLGVTIWEAISGPISQFANWVNTTVIQPVVSFFTALCTKITTIVQSIWSSIVSVFSGIATWVSTNIIQPIVSFVTGLWTQITTTVQNIWAGIVSVFGAAASWVYSTVIQPIVTFFTGLWTQITTIVTSIWNSIVSIWGTIASWVNSTVIQPIVSFFTSLWTQITSIVTNVWNSIVSIWGAIAGWVNSTVVQPIIGFFSGLWGSITSGVQSAVSTITGAFTGAVNTIKGAWNGIVSFFQNIWSSVSGIVGKIIDKGKQALGVKNSVGTKHATGGLITARHRGVVAEKGPEMIIPMVNSQRKRGLELWQQAGEMLGATQSPTYTPASTVPATTNTSTTNFAPVVNLTVNGADMDSRTLARTIKQKVQEGIQEALESMQRQAPLARAY